eukprot:g1473.t1
MLLVLYQAQLFFRAPWFTTASIIPIDGKIVVDFDDIFDMSGTISVASATIGVSVSVDTTTDVVTLTRDGSGVATPANSVVTIELNGVTNPPYAGATTTYGLSTTTASGVLIDEGTAAQSTFVAATLAAASVSLSAENINVYADASFPLALTFTTTNVLPKDGKIKLTLPSEFQDISTADVKAATASDNIDGSFLVTTSGSVITMTRLKDGTDVSPSTQVTMYLTGVQNPAASGKTGQYSVATTTVFDAEIDTKSSLAGSDIYGYLTPASLTFADLTVGVLTDVVVAFTTTGAIPADGKVSIVFPADFDGTASTVTVGTGIDAFDPPVVTVLGDGKHVVTLNRPSSAVATSAQLAVSFTLSNIRNPGYSGLTGTFMVKTLQQDDTPIDAAAVGAVTLTPGALGSTSVALDSNVVGVSDKVTIQFTTASIIPIDGKIVVDFDDIFDMSGTISVASATIGVSVSVDTTTDVVTLTRDGSGVATPANSVVTIELNGVTNPPYAGATTTYGLSTTTASGVLIDEGTAAQSTFVAATLAAASVSLSAENINVYADASFPLALTFTTTNVLPKDGKIKLTLPSEFQDISTADVKAATASDNIDGSFLVTTSGSVITMTRLKDGTDVSPSTQVTMYLTGVQNPAASGKTGQYSVATTTVFDAEIDTKSSLAGSDIYGYLTPASLTFADLTVGVLTDVVVAFTTTGAIPADGKVSIVFPADFDGTASTVTVGTGIDAFDPPVVTVLGDGKHVVTLNRPSSAVATSAQLAVSFTLSNIRNPGYSGLTGSFKIQTLQQDDTPIDAAAVGAVTLTSGTLANAAVALTNNEAASPSNVTVSFKTSTILPADGKIVVAFPNIFTDVSSAVAQTLLLTGNDLTADGGFSSTAFQSVSVSTSASGQLVTFTRDGSGGPIPAATIVGFNMTGITNPPVSGEFPAGVYYGVKTLDSLDRVIDEQANAGTSNIVAASLSPALVMISPLSQSTVAEPLLSDVTVTFTTKANIPIVADITITFPEARSASEPHSVFTGLSDIVLGPLSGISGSIEPLLINETARTVTIRRSADGDVESAGTAVSIVLQNITNPRLPGKTMPYGIAISTTDAGQSVDIETNPAVPGSTIFGFLESGLVALDNLVAGDATGVEVNFTTKSSFKATGYFEVTFPATSGASGHFSIETASALFDGVRNTIDRADPVPDVNIVGGDMRPTTIGFSHIKAGETTVLTLALTTTNIIPQDGNIEILMPSTAFDLTSATIDGTLSQYSPVAEIDGQILRAHYNRGDGNDIAEGTDITLVWANIVNPKFSGSTGDFVVSSTTNSSVDIDLNQTVLPVIIAPNVLPAAVALSSDLVNPSPTQYRTATVTFTTSNPIPGDGKIVTTFSAFAPRDEQKFDLSAVAVQGTITAGGVGIDGTVQTQVADTTGGWVVTVSRSGGSAVPAGSEIVMVLKDVVNPEQSGATGAYKVKTTLTDDVDIDVNDNVAESNIFGTLGSPTVTLSDNIVGLTPAITISFVPTGPIPADGTIVVQFPSTSAFTDVSLAAIDSSVTPVSWLALGENAPTVVGNNAAMTVTITRDGSGHMIEPPDTVKFALANIVNPPQSGATGAYTIKTTFSDGSTLIDDGTAAESNIVAGTVEATVTLLSLVAGESTTATVTFTTASIIPNDGKIVVDFPDGFTFSGTPSATSLIGIDGTVTTSVDTATKVVTLARSGGSAIPANTALSFVLSAVNNPMISGPTGVFKIKTTNLNAFAIDIADDPMTPAVSDDVAESTLIPAALSGATVVLDQVNTGEMTTATVTFTTTNPLPNTGLIVISFSPDAPSVYNRFEQVSAVQFATSGATCADGSVPTTAQPVCGVDGGLSISVSGLLMDDKSGIVTLERGGGGSDIPAGTTISFLLTNFRNPVWSGGTGPYTIQTKTGADQVIDEDLTVPQSNIFGTLLFPKVTLADNLVGVTTNVNVSFMPSGAIPADGQIIVVFPDSFTDITP